MCEKYHILPVEGTINHTENISKILRTNIIFDMIIYLVQYARCGRKKW